MDTKNTQTKPKKEKTHDSSRQPKTYLLTMDQINRTYAEGAKRFPRLLKEARERAQKSK